MTEQLEQFLTLTIRATQDDLGKILSCFKVRQIAKNEILLNDTETCRHIYFINSGSVRAYFIDEEGNEATRYIAFENNFITTLNSFITQTTSTEFLQATENGEVMAISYQDFRQLLSILPIWKDLYIKQLEIAYTTNTWRLESFIKMDAKQRYDYLFETNPKVIQRLSNKIVANYLGITQESLSRLKGKK
ncbi:MAG: Crp/Fnr family transcriptional regulator [Cytophagales bacterium]|nr:MAG: Crp/Fnr family transcriptional regulator [Cytophagales bacterium]